MRIEVEGTPPIKNAAKSLRAADHPHAERVAKLRKAMVAQVQPAERFEGKRLAMVVRYEHPPSRADGLNIANGIADVLQHRGNPDAPWVLDDDHNIVEFHYTEAITDHERYWVEIRPL